MGIRSDEQMIVKNRLTQVGVSFRAADSRRRRHAVFVCQCGSRKVLLIESVKRSQTKSCGCRNKEVRGSGTVTHGNARKGKHTPTYKSWRAMWSRCRATTGRHFDRYGLRGIVVCNQWQDFGTFLRDMGERPEGMTLERIDNDKGYSKENCCWATKRVQTRNTSRTIRVVHDGTEMCLSDACAAVGVSYSLVIQRIRRLGWSFEKAISKPSIRTTT
jgi:hypothetical protein